MYVLVQAETQTLEAVDSDPKQLARQLLSEGLAVDAVAEESGLSRPVVLGISGAMKKAQKRLAATEDKAAMGSPPGNQEEQEIIVDMKKEAQIASGAVTLARSQQRLRSLDSKAYQDLYGGQQSEVNSPSRALLDLEITRLVRAMRTEEQQGDHNNNGSNQVSELQRQMAELKEELHRKDVEALQKQSDKLEAQLVELRADIRSSAGSTSDLAVVIRESSQLLSQVITHDGPLRSYLLPDRVAIKARDEAPPLHQQAAVGNRGVVQQLEKYGLVTRVAERGIL